MSVVDQILRFLTTELERGGQQADLAPDTRLIDEGVLDSVSLMQLVAFLEQTFEIEVAPAEIVPDNFATVRDVAAMVVRAAAR